MVPNLHGLRLMQVKEILKENRLRLARRETMPSNLPPGTVVRQDPAVGVWVVPGRSVVVWISTGPPKVKVPDLKGRHVREAEEILTGARLNPGRTETKINSSRPQGTILDQRPEPGARAEINSQVDLVVATPAPTPFPWGWLIVGLTMIGLVVYYLLRVIPPPPPLPQVEIRIHQRAGEQTVSCESPRSIDLEVGLRLVPDSGTQDVKVEGSLILREKRA